VGPLLSSQWGKQASEFNVLGRGSQRRVLSSPLLVSTERSIKQVFDYGPSDGIDLKIEISKSDYVTEEIFESYVDPVLMAAVESNRTLEGCNNKLAVSFCDSCSAHSP
jgi:hypothetical protein